MEHTQAIQLNAAERYVLGELPSDLREQYEEHFFSCVACAEEVNLAAAFVENSRAAMGSEPVLPPVRLPLAAEQRPALSGWFGLFLQPRFALPVFAALLMMVAYQTFLVIPRLKGATTQSVGTLASTAPQALASFSLITAASRGGGEPLAVTVAPGKLFGLYFDIPPDGMFSSYICQLQNAAGATEFSLIISAEQAKNAVQLLIPSSSLGTGGHVLVVRGLGTQDRAGNGGTEVARYPFTFVVSH